MRFPSKLYRLEESVLWKLPPIIEIIKEGSIALSELCLYMKEKGVNPTEVIEALDCLYILEEVEYDEKDGVLIYVGGNRM